jgi:hypothetical protein
MVIPRPAAGDTFLIGARTLEAELLGPLYLKVFTLESLALSVSDCPAYEMYPEAKGPDDK